MTKKIYTDLDATGRTITAATFSGAASEAVSVDTTSVSTNASHYPVFVAANDGSIQTLGTDAGLIYNPSSNNLSIGGDFAVNGGDITTNQTTFNLLNTTVTTLNIGGASTTTTIGASAGNVTINGTLKVNTPLLTAVSTVGGGGFEGGQIDFARVTDGARYWSIDSYGTSASPSLRFIEDATTQISIDTGGIVNLSGALKVRTGGTTANTAPLYFGSTTNLLSSATAGAMEYTDVTAYITPANGGRAVDMLGHYYMTSALQGVDTASTVSSMLDSATLGITIAAGTTYEFEVMAPIQHTFVGSTTATTSFGLTTTTVTGTPTVSYGYQLRYGSNTTGFTTASADNVIWRTTGSQLVGAAITTGSRYIQCHMRGFIRVTGTGTAKVYPIITQSATGNSAYAQSGSFFKLTPIGNGTVNGIGNWA